MKLLNENQREKIARLINDKIDIPYIPEFMEYYIIKLALAAFEEKIYPLFPRDWQTFLNELQKGFIKSEAEGAEKAFAKAINPRIDIPFLDEKKEQELFKLFLSFLFQAMRKGFKI